MIIGLTGPIGSGKGTVVEILHKLGFSSMKFSDVLREMLTKEGKEINRTSLQDLGDKLRADEGGGAIAKRILKELKEKEAKYWVVDGFRNPAEVEEFRHLKTFILLGINSDIENRWERIQKRARDNAPKTFEEFKKEENRDKGIGQEDYDQQADACFKMADAYIMNNGTIEELEGKVKKLIGAFD